jgi:hypothetical protein
MGRESFFLATNITRFGIQTVMTFQTRTCCALRFWLCQKLFNLASFFKNYCCRPCIIVLTTSLEFFTSSKMDCFKSSPITHLPLCSSSYWTSSSSSYFGSDCGWSWSSLMGSQMNIPLDERAILIPWSLAKRALNSWVPLSTFLEFKDGFWVIDPGWPCGLRLSEPCPSLNTNWFFEGPVESFCGTIV